MDVRIGTSGWSYPSGYGSWKGIFYPKRWKGDELAYYAERFPAVEVNSTFYRVPAAETAKSWVARTPPGFRFTVKLFQKFTHPEMWARQEGGGPPTITEGDVAAMRRVLDALGEAGKLGALLVQYAEHVHHTPEHHARLVRTLDAFRDYPMAVELRHESWLTPHLRDTLGHFRAGLARIDEPYFSNLRDPGIPEASVEYWRFHGRNAAQWRARDAGAQRYDYLYTSGEIDELASGIEEFVDRKLEGLAFFNNHPHGKAAANAIELAERMGLALPYGKFSNMADTFPTLREIVGGGGTLPL